VLLADRAVMSAGPDGSKAISVSISSAARRVFAGIQCLRATSRAGSPAILYRRRNALLLRLRGSQIMTRIGVGLKPLQGLLTWGTIGDDEQHVHVRRQIDVISGADMPSTTVNAPTGRLEHS